MLQRVFSVRLNVRLLRLFFILLLMHGCTTGMRFTATLDAIDHGATPFAVGAMLSCVALFPAFFAVGAGRWLDRTGARKPMRLAFLCVCAAGGAALLFPTDAAGVAPLFLSCFLVGVAFLLTNTVVQRLTGDFSSPEGRTNAFVVLSMVTAGSGLVTPVVTGYMIEHFGFCVFYAWCVAAAVLLFVLALTPVLGSILSGAPRNRAKGAGRGRAVDLLKDPAMRAILAASVFISVGWEVGNLLIPVYCRSVELSPSHIGWILGSFSLASFFVRLLMPMLTRRLGEWRLISFTMLVAGAAFSLFPLFTDLFALMACAFLLGMGLGASMPNLMSLIYRLSPADRIGEAIGLRLMLMNLSKASFPALMGALGTAVGAGASLWGLAVFLFGGFGFAMRMRPTVTRALAEKSTRAAKSAKTESTEGANKAEAAPPKVER